MASAVLWVIQMSQSAMNCTKPGFHIIVSDVRTPLCHRICCQETWTIIWKHSCDCFKRSLRQKRIDFPDRIVFYPCVRDNRKWLPCGSQILMATCVDYPYDRGKSMEITTQRWQGRYLPWICWQRWLQQAAVLKICPFAVEKIQVSEYIITRFALINHKVVRVK